MSYVFWLLMRFSDAYFFERIIKKAAAESSCAAYVERGALVTAAALFIAAV